MADEFILWPLRAVSTDPTNLTKLDADNNVLTSTTDVDARYVVKAGDTMTGPLAVAPPSALAAPAGHVQISGEGFQPAVSIQGRGNANGTGTPQIRFLRTRGTVAAPASVQANDNLGTIAYYGWLPNGTVANPVSIIAQCDVTPDAGDTTAKGRITFVANTFTCATGTFNCQAANFTVSATGGVRVNRTEFGDAVRIDQTGTGTGQTSVALSANSVGSSLTSGSVTGVAGSVSGTCGVGIGVRGASAAIADVNYGLQAFASSGTIKNVGLYIGAELARMGTNFAIESQSSARSYFKGELGLNFAVPTHQLEVGGDTMLRGPLEVTGNITSSGTAHAFANGSIPSPAVIGNTPRTIAATGSAGSAGQMVWDDNFIYLRTAGGWKKVALTAI